MKNTEIKMHTIYQFLKQLLKLGEIKTEYPLIPSKGIYKEGNGCCSMKFTV